MYSKNAIPQLASAAMNHGFEDMFLRCAYHAKVMNRLEQVSKRTVLMMTAMMDFVSLDF